MYLIREGTPHKRALEFEISHRTAGRNPIFVRWHTLQMVAVPPKDRYRHYVAVPAFCQNWKAHRILCVPPPPLFVYFYIAFGDNAQRYGHLLLETAITKFRIMSFVYFIQDMDYGAADLFLPARLQALVKDGRLRVNEGVLVPLSGKMRADFLKRGLLRIICDCAVDPVAAILAFTRASGIDWAAPDCLKWSLYDFVDEITIYVLEWQS